MTTRDDLPFEDPDVLADTLGMGHHPTAQQRDVIRSGLSPLLVVAGAGSGKTATMADRVVWLVANRLARPEEILGVTFTRKAAGELGERLRGHLDRLRTSMGEGTDGDLALTPAVSTYHSFANSLVAEQGMRIGLEPDTPVWGPAQCWQLANRVVDNYDGEWEHLDVSHSTLVDDVLTYAGQAAEHLVDPASTVDWLLERADRIEAMPMGATARSKKPAKDIAAMRTHATVAELAGRYQAAKAERGVMDYGDLVVKAAQLASLPEVARHYRGRYKVVLLDEFQDTSYAQIELFARLFADGRHAVTAVGDPNQAIYGFRGASAGQLAAFRHRFALSSPNGERTPVPVAQLTTAWRNADTILNAANVIAAPLNKAAARGGVHTEPSVPQPAEPSAAVGHIKPITLPRPTKLQVDPLSPRPGVDQGRVVLAHATTSSEEATALAGFIAQVREDWRQRREDWPSTAVLIRAWKTAGPVAEALRDVGVPVEIVGLSGLLSTPEVQDIVATLWVLADPGRSDALLRLLAGARWRIGPADLMALSDWAQFRAKRRTRATQSLRAADFETPDGQLEGDSGHAGESEVVDQASLVEALDNLPRPGWESRHGRVLGERAHGRLARLRDELRGLRRLLGEELPLLVAEVVRTMGLDVEVLARPGLDEHAARRHLDAFSDVAAGFDGGLGEADLPTFLEWLEAAKEKEKGLSTAPEPAVDGTVQILTVHASKGLEWDVVAVPGLTRGVFPSGRPTRWTGGDGHRGQLPWPWRGDRDELPQFTALDDPSAIFEHQAEYSAFESDSRTGFAAEVALHSEAEERRLAYVAYTRARSILWCSATDFAGFSKEMVDPSPFFSEILDLDGSERGPWTQIPDEARSVHDENAAIVAFNRTAKQKDRKSRSEEMTNPESGVSVSAQWPYDPLAGPVVLHNGEPATANRRSRRPALEAAAHDVTVAMRAIRSLQAEAGDDAGAEVTLPEPSTEQGKAWWEEARLLLAQRSAQAEAAALVLPGHVRASLFVEAADDRATVERDLRRPVPHQPGIEARQGTAFHSWVEEHFGTEALFDLDDEAVYQDQEHVEGPDLEGLKAQFLKSEWAHRSPAFVEAPVETRIGPVSVRGRIDAVFRDADGRWDLVDWKTGRQPSAKELPKKALQLAVYRLGWARLHDIDVDQIDAAFYYVKTGKTVRPHSLAGEQELEEMITSLLG
ncbi:ATP-dependent DNA helicase [Galactobacter sp.]|uniref:ATP-dependent helicase n=1 Tax=Galactobacter sp. TaxID=2676125 RepID=UPI0025C1A06D|nr:ATP-dependent DNA helicase [Galactobacter sp.]